MNKLERPLNMLPLHARHTAHYGSKPIVHTTKIRLETNTLSQRAGLATHSWLVTSVQEQSPNRENSARCEPNTLLRNTGADVMTSGAAAMRGTMRIDSEHRAPTHSLMGRFTANPATPGS